MVHLPIQILYAFRIHNDCLLPRSFFEETFYLRIIQTSLRIKKTRARGDGLCQYYHGVYVEEIYQATLRRQHLPRDIKSADLTRLPGLNLFPPIFNVMTKCSN